MDDCSLIDLLWQRSEEALQALAHLFGRRLHTLALNILGSVRDAEENTNDTYLAIWNAIPPRRPDPLAGFVYQTGRNLALKKLRANTARKRDSRYDLSLEELSDCIPAPALEEIADARALGRTIDQWLDTLRPENRIIFLRRYWFGDDVRDIAIALGIRRNTVEVRLSRMRGQLKDYLIKEGHWND